MTKNRETDKPLQRRMGPKPERSYIKTGTKAATHPVRSLILKSLKESPRSTVDLEKITGEARYNLYHHLNLLEEVGLVHWELGESKTKVYSLLEPRHPEVAVLIVDEKDIEDKPKEFRALLDSMGRMEGREIPHPNKIIKAEICLYYDWDRKGQRP